MLKLGERNQVTGKGGLGVYPYNTCSLSIRLCNLRAKALKSIVKKLVNYQIRKILHRDKAKRSVIWSTLVKH